MKQDQEMPGHHILFPAVQIQQRVSRLAAEIAQAYGQEEFLAVSIMKGSFVFTADLLRALSEHQAQPVLDFITLSSYGSGTISRGAISIVDELTASVTGHRVLIIDDILDTGRTLQTACRLLSERGAKEVRTCVLLDKPARRAVPIEANYCGFKIENVFVVGYGLDYNNRFRQLPYLTTLTPPPAL
ncbi:MAG: hypoxanthine phosphoribosyltransferase [bacterium]